MGLGAIMKTDAEAKAGIFRLFISYAKEDEKIAIAVSNAIQTALGPSAEVFIDSGLRFGLSFQDEIKKKLDETNVLVVIYSSALNLKPAFSFTGMELGYFLRVMEHENSPDFPRRIVPIYLEKPPDILAENEGINIGISRSTLSLTFEEYEAGLGVDFDNNMVKFLREFQGLVDKLREDRGAAKVPQTPDQRDLLGLVKKMQLAIFSHLKTTPESTIKPQKQIIIKTSDAALESVEHELPPDAILTPVGTGNPMSIFGLPSTETTWGDFQKLTINFKFRDSWIDAITSVVASALQSQLEVDNSQLIVSYDEKHAFRIILTTGTRYYNGVREFNLYFVEYLKRGDFGDRETTTLFKGLELLFRFRSLFLERNSDFSSMNLKIANQVAFKEYARNMERELNLLRRDALEVGLDKASVWAEFVDWARLLKMSEVWRPLDLRIRDALTQIRGAEGEALEPCRASLVTAIQELETTMRPLNGDLICEMTENLKKFCAN
jgi:hypothetical protein